MDFVERLIHSPPVREDWEYSHTLLIEKKGLSMLYIDNKASKTNIFCHGVKCDVVDAMEYIDKAPKTSNHVFFDYPGYGMSKGVPSQQSAVEAIAKIVEIFEGEKTLIGHSMGCCLLAEYCSTYQWKDPVIFLAPFYSLQDLFPLKLNYRTYEYVEKMVCKITYYHGSKDDLIPATHSIKLAAIHGSDIIINDSDHRSILNVLFYVLETTLSLVERPKPCPGLGGA